MTFEEYMNSKKYRERILELLRTSRPALSERSFEMMAAPLNRELERIDSQLKDYVDVLLNSSSQSIRDVLISDIERHSSMVVKGQPVAIFFNTPFRVAPHARVGGFWSINESTSQLTMWRESIPLRLGVKPYSYGQPYLHAAPSPYTTASAI
jgi:hypothetical protein